MGDMGAHRNWACGWVDGREAPQSWGQTQKTGWKDKWRLIRRILDETAAQMSGESSVATTS